MKPDFPPPRYRRRRARHALRRNARPLDLFFGAGLGNGPGAERAGVRDDEGQAGNGAGVDSRSRIDDVVIVGLFVEDEKLADDGDAAARGDGARLVAEGLAKDAAEGHGAEVAELADGDAEAVDDLEMVISWVMRGVGFVLTTLHTTRNHTTMRTVSPR